VLTMRYIFGKKWVDIARRLNYSVSHIYRIHDRALEKMRVNESI